MAIVKGTVEAISRKKVGNGFAYSFLVNDNWHRHGFDKPKFEKGFMVQFDDTQHEYGVIDISTVKYKKGTAVNNSSAGSTARSAGKSNSQAENWDARAKYWEDKEKRDLVTNEQYNYRSAFHLSADLTKWGIDNGHINLRKTKSFEAFLVLVEGLAADLYAKFMGVGNGPSEPEQQEPVDDKVPATDPEGQDSWEELEDDDEWMN